MKYPHLCKSISLISITRSLTAWLMDSHNLKLWWMLPNYRSKRFCYQFTCSAIYVSPQRANFKQTFSLYSSNSWKLVILKCFHLQILQSSTLEKWLEFKTEAYWASKTEQNSILFTPRGLSTNLLSYEKGLLFSRQDWNLHKVRCLYLKEIPQLYSHTEK